MIVTPTNSEDCDARSGPTAADPVAGTPRPAGERFDAWRTAHRALRGRYRLALLVAAAGAAAGACTGMMTGKRLYSATGVVRIASVLPQVMRETDQNRPMAMFDGYIQAQKEVMTSRELVETAIKQEPWRQTPGANLSAEGFAANLKVETRPRSDHLRVIFTHKNATVAAAAVRSMIVAYQQAFTREQDRVERNRMDQLKSRRATLAQQLQAIDGEVGALARGRTIAELDALYTVAAERLKKLRSALADVQCAMAGGPDVRQGATARLPGDIADDEILRLFASEQARIETQLAQARARGCTPLHASVIRLEAMAKACRERVDTYSEECETRRIARGTAATSMSLADREASLRELTQTAENELKELTAERAQLAVYEERAAPLRKDLSDTDARIDALATEASLGSRLTVITSGDRPLTARIDRRAKTAALGAMMGMAAPVGWLILTGTRRRRYRFADDVAADLLPQFPFVAVLPELNGEDAASATGVQCVHDLRVRLQPPAGGSPRTYLITSASSGEGKSSVAIALSLSFAASGFRTLLIDADLSSRFLTAGFESADSPGLVEAAAGQQPTIRRVRVGASIMTTGRCGPQEGYKLSPAAVGRILADLRERFDVVLIDSDSVLNGLTASSIAAQVDGVILTLTREQDESQVKRATTQLQALGARLSAAVFTRASASDWSSSQTAAPTSALPQRILPDRLKRFGPLVSAMLSSLGLSRENELDVVPSGVMLSQPDVPQRAVA
jgi:polysaccharide biosynthesis transport protein